MIFYNIRNTILSKQLDCSLYLKTHLKPHISTCLASSNISSFQTFLESCSMFYTFQSLTFLHVQFLQICQAFKAFHQLLQFFIVVKFNFFNTTKFSNLLRYFPKPNISSYIGSSNMSSVLTLLTSSISCIVRISIIQYFQIFHSIKRFFQSLSFPHA